MEIISVIAGALFLASILAASVGSYSTSVFLVVSIGIPSVYFHFKQQKIHEKIVSDYAIIRAAEQENYQHEFELKQRKVAIVSRIDKLLKDNTELLVRAYKNTVTVSNLGVRNYTRLKKELFEFIDLTVSEDEHYTYTTLGTNFKREYKSWMADELIRVFEENNATALSPNTVTLGGSPRDYEFRCAKSFEKIGWKVEVTKASGDQGVDLIVEKNGIRLAVQCKMYEKPVGNAAIQEVAAGRNHYGADSAVVVAPNGFTTAARQLAESNRVTLIHHDEIERLEVRVSK